MRRACSDALISGGSVCLLLTILIALDERVRNEFWRQAAAPPSVNWMAMGNQVRDFIAILAEAARHQSLAHAPMLIFALAAAVLTVFMLRT